MKPESNPDLARAEARVEAHSASLKKELGVRDLTLTQILFIVGLTWIGVAGKLGPSHVVFWLLALVLFFILFSILVRVARRATDPFTSLVIFGILGLLFTHVFENVGMTVNVMPITGIPLPFFSYGGSFVLATALSVGLVFRAAWDARLGGYVDN